MYVLKLRFAEYIPLSFSLIWSLSTSCKLRHDHFCQRSKEKIEQSFLHRFYVKLLSQHLNCYLISSYHFHFLVCGINTRAGKNTNYDEVRRLNKSQDFGVFSFCNRKQELGKARRFMLGFNWVFFLKVFPRFLFPLLFPVMGIWRF